MQLPHSSQNKHVSQGSVWRVLPARVRPAWCAGGQGAPGKARPPASEDSLLKYSLLPLLFHIQDGSKVLVLARHHLLHDERTCPDIYPLLRLFPM